VADVWTPRAPKDLPFLRVNDEQRPPKPYGGAVWVYPNDQKEEPEQQERVWVDDDPAYDSDATLPIEGDYAYATEAERATRHHLLRAPAAAVSVRVCLEWQPKTKRTWSGAARNTKKASQLDRATRRMGKAIGEEINARIPVGEPLLCFGRGVNDDVDLMGKGKGVVLHAAKIMAALDRLRAAADGVLVQCPECLPRGVRRCPALHAYLDAWAAHVYH
jgi:hypothetical protein